MGQSADKQIINIINKSKDGIMLKAPGGKVQKMSWEEFNQNFVMTEDKKHCHCTEAFAKKMEEIDELTADIIVAMKFIEAEQRNGGTPENPGFYLAQLATVGENMPKLQEMLGCTGLEALQFVRTRMNAVFGPNAFKQHKETPSEYRERKRDEAAARKRRQEEMNPHRTYTPTATSSMADIPGMDKLKAMFADEK